MTTIISLKTGRIVPSKMYNIQTMIELNIFPWLTGFSDRHMRREYAEIIARDALGENLLGVSGCRRGEYLIKGKALKQFIKVYGPGLALAKNNAYEKESGREKGAGEKESGKKASEIFY
jgi:hypothetical protein